MRIFLRQFVFSLTWVTLFFLGHLTSLMDINNRYWLYFQRVDAYALVCLILLLALLVAGIFRGVDLLTCGKIRIWLTPVFYLCVGIVLMDLFLEIRLALGARFPFARGVGLYLTSWGIGGVFTLLAYALYPLRKLAEWGWRISFCLFPLFFVLAVQLIFAENPKLSETMEFPAASMEAAGTKGPPVVFLCLDMVGYGNVFDNTGAVREDLPALREFSQTAAVYHAAQSGGEATVTSLVGFYLQARIQNLNLGGEMFSCTRASDESGALYSYADFSGTLLDRLDEAGYRNMHIGFYLPFDSLMPGRFAFHSTRSVYGTETDFSMPPFVHAAIHQLGLYLNGSISPVAALSKQLDLHTKWQDHYRRVRLTGDIQAESKRLIEEVLSPGDFLFIHLFPAHDPFVFAADGSPINGRSNPKFYRGQLIYGDALLGELMDALKATGKWDESWVAVFADHGLPMRFAISNVWTDERLHIPFFVKAPGQTVPMEIRTPFDFTQFEIPGFPF